jgi:hypothetical protein
MTVVRIPQQDSASELSTNSHEPLQHKVETLKRYWGGGEQTMPRGVATARGGCLDGGSSRLDPARRTSLMELHRLNFLAAAVRSGP